MKINFKKIFFLTLAVLVFSPSMASAHQPRIVKETTTVVTDPEISKAYYGKLEGAPQFYKITAPKAFDLYVNVLAPDIPGQKKDISFLILKNGKPLITLDGTKFEWSNFFEPFGHDTYWKGPEYKMREEAGDYEIRVWSANNDSKYSLAIGEIEAFDFKEGLNAMLLVPELKRDFFDESPIDFILSPFGWSLIIVLYVLSFITGFIYRSILKRLAKNSSRKASHNIGRPDRLLRFALSIGLLLWAITTSWSPILIFFSGFTLFESIFSWCGFYAAIGKNTCSL